MVISLGSCTVETHCPLQARYSSFHMCGRTFKFCLAVVEIFIIITMNVNLLFEQFLVRLVIYCECLNHLPHFCSHNVRKKCINQYNYPSRGKLVLQCNGLTYGIVWQKYLIELRYFHPSISLLTHNPSSFLSCGNPCCDAFSVCPRRDGAGHRGNSHLCLFSDFILFPRCLGKRFKVYLAVAFFFGVVVKRHDGVMYVCFDSLSLIIWCSVSSNKIYLPIFVEIL